MNGPARANDRPNLRPLELARHPAAAVVALAVMVIGLIWTTVAALVVTERQQVFDDAHQELLGAQRVLGNHMGRIFESASTMMIALDTWMTQASRMPLGTSLDELSAVIDRMHGSAADVMGVRLLNIDGYMIRFGDRGADGLYVGDREYIASLRDREPGAVHIGVPIVSRDTQRDLIPVVMRVRPNVFGVAYVAVGIRLQPLRDAYHGYLVTAPGAFGIIRQDGIVLLHSPDEAPFTGSRIADFDLDRLIARRGATGIFEHKGPASGLPRLTAFTVLDPYRLLAYATMHVDALNAKWVNNSRDDIGMGALASVAVIALSAWILMLIRQKERAAAQTVEALQQAEAANSAKSDFMARMSHELRTPLNAILGFSEMIADRQFEALAGRFRDYARDIHMSGRHLLGLIDQVLDISKIESGVVELHEEQVELRPFLDECLASVRPLVEAGGLVASLTSEPGVSHLSADRKRLRQMVLNLLSNAVKFTHAGGRIAIHARLVADGIDIAISDSGVGIADDARLGIFEPFGRGNSDVSREIDGIGLGLPITKALIELHGGSIHIASATGQGTTATLHFPARRVVQPRFEAAA